MLLGHILGNALKRIWVSFEIAEDSMDFRGLFDLAYLQADVEAVDQIHLLEDMSHAGCANDHQFAVLVWRGLLDLDQKCLEDDIWELITETGEFNQSLYFIKNDQRQFWLVGVIEDLYDL